MACQLEKNESASASRKSIIKLIINDCEKKEWRNSPKGRYLSKTLVEGGPVAIVAEALRNRALDLPIRDSRTGIPKVILDKTGRRPADTSSYTENELPQPQLPVAFGLLNVNPDPITEFT